MLHMILGEAGTGKTEEVLRRIRQAVAGRQTVLLIVPEHASFEMERRAGSRLSDEEAYLHPQFSASGGKYLSGMRRSDAPAAG